MSLYAGIFETDITPPHFVPMAPRAGNQRTCASIHDSLYCRTLVLDNGRARACILSSDLCSVSSAFANSTRAAVAAALETTLQSVLIACSGTELAPDTESEAADGPYLDVLQRKLVGSAAQAADGLEPCYLTHGEASAQIGAAFELHSAGDGETPKPIYSAAVSQLVQTVCINGADGRLMAMLFTHACAAASMPGCAAISSDWPGAAAARLKSRFQAESVDGSVRPGALPIFLAGWGGDVRPVRCGTWEGVAESGRQIGDAAHAARWNAHGRQSDELAAGEVRFGTAAVAAEGHGFSWMRIGGVLFVAAPSFACAALQLELQAAAAGPLICVGGANGSDAALSHALARDNDVVTPIESPQAAAPMPAGSLRSNALAALQRILRNV